MTNTINDEELLKLYTQIAGDAYGLSEPTEFNNAPNNAWTKVPLFIDDNGNDVYYYDINDSGCNIAIYYNETTKEVIVGIRGTEPFANDGGFADLKILKGDGTLQSLMEAGIEFISLNTQNIRQFYDDDSEMFARGTFTKTNGNVQEYGEFNLVRRLGLDPTLKIRGIQNRNKSAA